MFSRGGSRTVESSVSPTVSKDELIDGTDGLASEDSIERKEDKCASSHAVPIFSPSSGNNSIDGSVKYELP